MRASGLTNVIVLALMLAAAIASSNVIVNDEFVVTIEPASALPNFLTVGAVTSAAMDVFSTTSTQ